MELLAKHPLLLTKVFSAIVFFFKLPSWTKYFSKERKCGKWNAINILVEIFASNKTMSTAGLGADRPAFGAMHSLHVHAILTYKSAVSRKRQQQGLSRVSWTPVNVEKFVTSRKQQAAATLPVGPPLGFSATVLQPFSTAMLSLPTRILPVNSSCNVLWNNFQRHLPDVQLNHWFLHISGALGI